MSSTSSSECVCDEYYQDSCGHGNYYDAPYQTGKPPVYSVGHPLIYYAQVQHQPMTRRQSSRENRKGNRNFFKRAFRWYTREHVPAQRSPDISGFATWLDAKYGEYLRESLHNQTSRAPPQQLKQTPTSEPDVNSCDLCDACVNKKNAHTRSSWKKRLVSSKEAGDVSDKLNKSCEFIMRPKDSTRQASECCHTTPTSVHKKSTTTLVSSHTDSANKTKIKSLSLTTCCCHENESLNKKPIQDGIKENEAEKLIKIIAPEAKETKILEKPKQRTEKQEDEISCQCPEDKVVTVDNGTQYYDDMKAEQNKKCCSADQMKQVPSKQSKQNVKTIAGQQKDVGKQKNIQPKLESDVICQCSDESIKKVDAQCQYQSEFGARPDNTSHAAICECQQEIRSTCPATIRLPGGNVMETQHIRDIIYTRSRPLTILVSDVAQTSDHSINLDKETIHGYPLFMKIVRADKLH